MSKSSQDFISKILLAFSQPLVWWGKNYRRCHPRCFIWRAFEGNTVKQKTEGRVLTVLQFAPRLMLQLAHKTRDCIKYTSNMFKGLCKGYIQYKICNYIHHWERRKCELWIHIHLTWRYREIGEYYLFSLKWRNLMAFRLIHVMLYMTCSDVLINMLSSCRIICISSFVCKPSVTTYPCYKYSPGLPYLLVCLRV